MIDKIESEVDLEKEESCKKEESKKQEDKRKLFRKAEVKKKEDEESNIDIDLKVMTRMTNLQGLGPETRQGPSPASSYLDSGNLARGTRSSPVGSN